MSAPASAAHRAGGTVELVVGPVLARLLEPHRARPDGDRAAFALVEVTRDGVPGRSADAVRADIVSWRALGLPVAAWVSERVDPDVDTPSPVLADVDLVATLSRSTRDALAAWLGDSGPPVVFLPAAASTRVSPPARSASADEPVRRRGDAVVTWALPGPGDDGRTANAFTRVLNSLRERGGLSLVLDPDAPGADGAVFAGPPAPARPEGSDDGDEAPTGPPPDGDAGEDDTAAGAHLDAVGAAATIAAAPVGADTRDRLQGGLRRTAAVTTAPRLLEHVRAAGAWADGSDVWAATAWTTLAAAGSGAAVAAPAEGLTPGDALPDALLPLVERATGAPTLRALLVGAAAQPEHRDRLGHLLHRAVMASETLEHRIAELAAALGVAGVAAPGPESVSCVVPTNRPHQLDNVLASVGRQAHRDTELVLVLHGLEGRPGADTDDASLTARAREHGVEHLVIRHAPATHTLGACMNLGLEAASGRLVAKMDDDNVYGEHYLGDLQLPFRYTDAGIVGKWAHYVWLRSTGAVVLRYPDAEHAFTRRVQGGSMLFRGDLVRELRFSDIPRAVDTDILDRAAAEGVGVYSADRYNYVSVRGTDRTSHTWTVEDATFLTPSGRLVFHGDPREHVTI